MLDQVKGQALVAQAQVGLAALEMAGAQGRVPEVRLARAAALVAERAQAQARGLEQKPEVPAEADQAALVVVQVRAEEMRLAQGIIRASA